MSNKLKIFIIVYLFFLIEPSFGQSSERRDGNWWNSISDYSQDAYITGFFDGIRLGNNFSYWNFTNDEDKSYCLSSVFESFDFFKSTYLINITNTQVADGLDNFYSNYRNRSIKIHDAVWIVLNSIAGTPQERIDELIESWRKNAK